MTPEDLEKYVDDIFAAQCEAEEILQIVIMQFLTFRKNTDEENEKRGAITILGLEFALMNHAARVAFVERDLLGARFTKTLFVKTAREQYENIEKYRTKKTRKQKSKISHLKLVKSEE